MVAKMVTVTFLEKEEESRQVAKERKGR